jgi:hypothetical protein
MGGISVRITSDTSVSSSSVCALELPCHHRNNFRKGTYGKPIGYREFGRFGTGFGFLLETGVTQGTH